MLYVSCIEKGRAARWRRLLDLTSQGNKRKKEDRYKSGSI